MHLQPNAEIIETPIFTMWIDEEILCFISKRHPPQTTEESEALFREIKKISHAKKRCWLMDVTHLQLPTKEARDYGAPEIPKLTFAIAFLSDSKLGAFGINLLLKLKPQPYPTKMFTDEQDAREWLKQYL